MTTLQLPAVEFIGFPAPLRVIAGEVLWPCQRPEFRAGVRRWCVIGDGVRAEEALQAHGLGAVVA